MRLGNTSVVSFHLDTESYAIASRWCSYRLWALPSRSVDNSPFCFLLQPDWNQSWNPVACLWIIIVVLVRLQLVALSLVLVQVFPHIFDFECRLRRPSTINMPGGGRFFGPLEFHLLRLCLRNLLLCRLGEGRMFVLLACNREESLLQVRITFFTLLLIFLLHTYTVCLIFL